MSTKAHQLHTADQTLSNDEGRFDAYRPAPGVLITEVVGYLAHEFALALITHLDAIRASGQRALQFHDWFAVTGYDIRAQRDLTAWHAKHRVDVEGLEIGVRSAMLRMGVTVANVPLRGLIKLHEDELAFSSAARNGILSRRVRAPHASGSL
ncbi:MAG: hypothetical protein KC593_02775 [Myxococcales bacterium]|nr:hypothetical protein [Myxococcales bacterium]MCB9630218.1 hypothetical protein [Sandaracinaceae bacterium]